MKEKVLGTIRYFDLFDYPLKTGQIVSLLGYENTTEVLGELKGSRQIEMKDDYCFTPGKEWSVEKRLSDERLFKKEINKIRFAAWIISQMPFVKSIMLTGSASKGVFDKYDDYDFLIIAAKNRMWFLRIIIGMFTKAISMNYKTTIFRHFCCNYIISEEFLEIHDKNEFTALELFHSQPLFNLPLYQEFIERNSWAGKYYNLNGKKQLLKVLPHGIKPLRFIFEAIAGVFWNNNAEKILMKAHCAHWIKKGVFSNKEEFDVYANMKYIKASRNSRVLLLDELRNTRKGQLNNKIRTKALLRNAGNGNKKDSLLVTHAYYFNRTKLEQRIMKPYVPLGPLSIVSYLKSKGLKAEFYDTTFKKSMTEFSRHIFNNNFPVIGIYVMETTRKNALEMIDQCRAAGSVVVVGGPDASVDPDFYLENGASIAVVGEGELTMHEVMESILTGNKQIYDIRGVRTKHNKLIKRELIEKMDDLPMPARDVVDFNPYFNAWRKHYSSTSMLLTTSRGCPYNCSWCAKPVFGSTFRQRPAEKVAEEIQYLKKNYQPDRLWITDDIFTLDKKWIRQFHHEILSKNALIPFECLSRVDLVDEDILAQLKEAGCYKIWYGIESGSQKILDKMNKKFTVENIRNAVQKTRNAGINTGFFVMLGYEGETISDIDLTRKIITETIPEDCGLAMAYPMKGTRFYDEVKGKLRSSAKVFRLENDNRLVFKATYPPFFYKIARKLINREYYINRHAKNSFKPKIKHGIYKAVYKLTGYALSRVA